MCGIYGAISLSGARVADRGFATEMAKALRHRGPDGHGTARRESGVIGATRLRVVDPDPAGDQPFADPDGTALLVINGEIYNAEELRARYSTYQFRSRTDVECVLPLLLAKSATGIDDLDGMFALVLWQPERRRLILARDRAGEKPLFYARRDDQLLFASEIGALLAAGGISAHLDHTAASQFARNGCVEEPRTLIRGIRSVPAGSVILIDPTGERTHRYWDVDAFATSSTPPDIAALEATLTDAVERQLRADVPLGVFTSGGVDSSLLAVHAARKLGERLVTCSVGFPDHRYDERPFARRLANTLGGRHITAVADYDAMRAALDELVLAGEPIADPAAMPTLILAKAAREHVTVVMSGEGADELFGGYPTYLGHRHAGRFTALPQAAQTVVRSALRGLPNSTGRVPLPFLLRRFVADAARPWEDRHRQWFGTGLPVSVLQPEWRGADLESAADHHPEDVVGSAMRLDYRLGLRQRLLVKLDRATMRASLEARAPFLDRRLTQMAFEIPGWVHVGGTSTKRVLKAVARRSVPRFIVHRRKRGLSVPIAEWLNGSLASEIHDLLGRDRLRRQGIFNTDTVERLVTEHRTRRMDHSRGLWALFTFQHWMDRWGVTP